MIGEAIINLQFTKEKKACKSRDLPYIILETARKVRYEWDTLSEKERKALLDLYFKMVGERKYALYEKITGLIFMFYIWIRHGFEHVIKLTEAVYELKYALTDVVERATPEYQGLISSLITRASEPAKEFTPEDIDALFEEVESNSHP